MAYAVRPVTDPAILAQLEAGEPTTPPGLKPVTDPALIAQLEAPETPERSLPEKLVRAGGRTVRAVAQGGADLLALPGTVYDAAADAFGAPGPRFRSREAVRNALTKLGLPEAENPTERIVEDVVGGMTGAGGIVRLGTSMAAAATPLAQRIGSLLKTAPGAQVTAGATGPGAASMVREEGGGPVAQTVAGVAGAFAPSIPTAVRAAGQVTLRGGEAGRQQVKKNIETFEAAGAGTPTVGQATESSANRAVESLLSKAPGSAGRMVAKAEAEAAGLGAKVDEMASDLAGRTGAAPAGRKIKSGFEEFVEKFKGKSNELYDKLDRHIPKTARVDVSNTRSALEKLNADIPGAPNVSQLFKNARIKGVQGALKADTETPAGVFDALPAWQKQLLEQMPEVERTAMLNGLIDAKLPYEALKKLRTLVGNEISDSTIASDVPRSKWKALYAALSKDMGAAAREAGPEGEKAFVRANLHHSAGMKRLEDVLDPILNKGDPEDVFQAAISGSKEGATTISGVMKSLPKESKNVVAATMLRRLGKALPGKQDDLGETFSSETFLTNWNRLHPDAKRSLFSAFGPQMRSDLDRIANVTANLRDGSKVFANPSGTGQVISAQVPGYTAAALAFTGNVGSAAMIALTPLASNVAARIMTSPKFVRWLAQATEKPLEQMPAQLNQLFQQSLYMNGDERKDVREFVKKAREATALLKAGQATSSR